MKYEIVELEPKTVVGISAVTSNNDPEMQKKIGDLWTRLYPGGEIAKIKNRANSFAIGLYSDYEGDNYCVTAGCEVTEADNDDMVIKPFPEENTQNFLCAEIWLTLLPRRGKKYGK